MASGPKRGSVSSQSRADAFGRYVSTGSSRAFLPIVLFLGAALIFFGRLIYLDVIVQNEYATQAQNSHTVGLTVEPRRGTIYDRNGKILAISVDATTVYCNPSEISDPTAIAAAVASCLGGTYKDYVDALSADNASFAYVKRKADVNAAQALRELELPGIYFLDDTRRVYPYGEVGGQIVGGTNTEVDVENNREFYVGISGLEYYYDQLLSGTPGYYEAEIGANGTPIPGGVHEKTPAVDGTDIVISVDIDFQKVVEDALKSNLERMGVSSGNAIVMDGGTGELYAIASTPYFNPADRSVVPEGSMQLKSITNLLEPGSMFKTVSATCILEAGSMDVDDTLFCPAVITADEYEISDAHERLDTTYTFRQIIEYSSNVGISLAVENMGFDKLYDCIDRYNLHELSGVDYPGEQLGYLVDFGQWSRVTGYNVAFGQGISMTPIQLIRFYGALVNDGVECTPHFVTKYPESGEVPHYDTEQVIVRTDAIPKMNSMLQTVVEEGTGVRAGIEGYNVAGKTSTAEIYDEENGGYKYDIYNLGFCGFICDSNSKFVCYVGANDVIGDGVVTPIFHDIMVDAVSRYNIVSTAS